MHTEPVTVPEMMLTRRPAVITVGPAGRVRGRARVQVRPDMEIRAASVVSVGPDSSAVAISASGSTAISASNAVPPASRPKVTGPVTGPVVYRTRFMRELRR